MAIQIRERERLQQLLNEREQMVASLCTAYEVKEGETVESICQSVYGSAEIADEIREFNGLEQGENPQTGQKILLP
jgi:predicted Zn-dependent protease